MAERLFMRLDEDPAHGPDSSAPGGLLESATVAPPLRAYVAQLLLYRESVPPGARVVERVVPDGSVRLVFNLGDAPSAGPLPGHAVEAIGASAAPALVRLAGRLEGVSVALRPGAVSALLGAPARAIRDNAVHLDELWRGDGARLLERMATAQDDAARLALLQHALLERLRQSRVTVQTTASRAAALITSAAGRLSMRELARSVGVGERRLQQLFDREVGLSPRAFSRLSRLHACLRLLRREQRPSWAEVAADAGYYDQAHLVNEFRKLCGLSPTSVLDHVVSRSSKTAS